MAYGQQQGSQQGGRNLRRNVHAQNHPRQSLHSVMKQSGALDPIQQAIRTPVDEGHPSLCIAPQCSDHMVRMGVDIPFNAKVRGEGAENRLDFSSDQFILLLHCKGCKQFICTK